MNTIDKNSKIYVAGHRGMVGSAILRNLTLSGHENIVTRTSLELNLTCQQDVRSFFETEPPEYVFLAAAKVGGIHANNTLPVDFLYNNLMIQANVMEAAFKSKVKQLLFLGSSCIYPKNAVQPMKENALLTGPLEPTNEPYAIAKITGIKLCESYNRQYGTRFRSVMPTNLYGKNDNFHPENSHVIPGLMRKFHDAKINDKGSISVWGTGNARREFLHVDDMASACIRVMTLSQKEYQAVTTPFLSHINIGSGKDISIRELAGIMKEVVGYKGRIQFDESKPDGPARKLLDISILENLDWIPEIGLKQGLAITYQWLLKNIETFRSV